ncbi:MAG: hypothetical protein M3Y79_05765 [Pseudomonadota bacterium]|nr:hypothetical protein [Pseudomonadota bacterium]
MQSRQCLPSGHGIAKAIKEVLNNMNRTTFGLAATVATQAADWFRKAMRA